MSIPILIIVFYAALHDIRYNRISNSTVLTIIIIGIIQVVLSSLQYTSIVLISPLEAFTGFFISLFISIFLYSSGLFGAGDAKLLASLGIILGPFHILILIAFSIAFSGLLSILRLSCYGELLPMLSRWYQSMKIGYYLKPDSNTVASGAVPMGGAILLATVFCEFYMF
ncbi:prepilin peptidase [Photobacterium satsumensis]|uniref:prepilin peptidase n=1 Tax=Photobacterium satsumensis TaxID=2910239 RepID=UPI003D143478